MIGRYTKIFGRTNSSPTLFDIEEMSLPKWFLLKAQLLAFLVLQLFTNQLTEFLDHTDLMEWSVCWFQLLVIVEVEPGVNAWNKLVLLVNAGSDFSFFGQSGGGAASKYVLELAH